MSNLNPTATNTAGFPNAIAIYYDRRLLKRLEFKLVIHQWGQKRTLPKASGNQVKFTRYSNFAAVTTPLTEGVIPDGEQLQSVQIGAIPVEYGNYVTLTDLLITEAIDPVIKSALDVLGYQAALSLDTIIQTTLHGTLTDQFSSGTNEGNTTGVMTASEVRRGVFKLDSVGAEPIKDSAYVLEIHPAQAFDLKGENATGGWLDINKYTTPGPLYKGEIGSLYGARVVQSQNIQSAATGPSGATIYRAFMFADECFGVVDLAGHNLKMIAKQLGESGVADPLDQLSTVGYKFAHVTKTLDSVRGIEMHTQTAAS